MFSSSVLETTAVEGLQSPYGFNKFEPYNSLWEAAAGGLRAVRPEDTPPSPRQPGPARGAGDTRGNSTETTRPPAVSVKPRGPLVTGVQ